jgi:hypothetical protein
LYHREAVAIEASRISSSPPFRQLIKSAFNDNSNSQHAVNDWNNETVVCDFYLLRKALEWKLFFLHIISREFREGKSKIGLFLLESSGAIHPQTSFFLSANYKNRRATDNL